MRESHVQGLDVPLRKVVFGERASAKPAFESLDQMLEAALDEAKPKARTLRIAETIIDRHNPSLEPLSRQWAIEELTLLLRRKRRQRTRIPFAPLNPISGSGSVSTLNESVVLDRFGSAVPKLGYD